MPISTEVSAFSGLAVAVISLILLIVIMVRVFKTGSGPGEMFRVDEAARTERAVREELATARGEAATSASLLREEVAASIRALGHGLRSTMTDLASTQKAQLDSFGSTLAQAKQESSTAAQALREEVTNALTRLGTTLNETVTNLSAVQAGKLDDVTKQIAALTESNEARQEALKTGMETRLTELRTEAAANAVQIRDEIAKTLKAAGDGLKEILTQMSELQRERLTQVTASLGQMTEQHKQQQDALRTAVETRLDTLRTENAEKLEQMRVTVDEKLQSTLEQRLGSSFKLVSEQLEQVYKSMGEMQNLAAGVGDLKRVLTNVRARGAWGEVVLGSLLEQMLTPDQYAANVEVAPDSNRRVEFAIKFPGHTESDGPVWLPIDSKFPHEAYERLAKAAELGNAEAVDAAGRELENVVRGSARDIAEKYVAPPHSTDFGVLFLPTEGLFAEVIRRPGLTESLQREFRVSVTGPTTLAAFLNSLRMGFRTLAIQKRSSEVWQVLGAVKTEFGKYAKVMEQVKKKLVQASDEIDNVAVRQRAIDRKLRGVEAIPEADATELLALPTAGMDAAGEEPAAEDAA